MQISDYEAKAEWSEIETIRVRKCDGNSYVIQIGRARDEFTLQDSISRVAKFLIKSMPKSLQMY